VREQFETYESGDWLVIEATGDLDLAEAPALRQQVVGLLGQGHRRFVIDLRAVGHIDSIGLGMFVAIRKRVRVHGGEVELVCPDPRLRRVFTVVDLDRVFTLHATREAAQRPGRGTGTA
jgi:anti-sigma B factor antagonist